MFIDSHIHLSHPSYSTPFLYYSPVTHSLSTTTRSNLIEEFRSAKISAVIEPAIETANSSILKEAAEHETMSGMGTTIVLTTIVGDYAYVANVGDSRLYLINDERIIQITKDHSLVEEMVRMGEISEEDARNHPDKNVITRALGATKDVAVDFFDVHLEPGDRLLLCSDGLTNMVLDEDIEDIIVSEELLETAGKRLVEAANENGGKDNIGIVLVEPDTKEVEVC